MVAVVVLTVTGCGGKNAANPTSAGDYRYVGTTPRGQVIPVAQRRAAGPAVGTLIGGGTVALSQYRGKVVVVNFWASWCGPCRAESPQLEAVFRAQKAHGVQFVGIDIKDEKQAAAAFVKDAGVSYPIIFDQLGRTALQLGAINVQGLPITAMLDRAGRVAAIYSGGVTAADIEPAITALVAEK